MHGICRTGAAVGLILALALLRHTGADKIEEHDAPLFHTANHPAVVKVTPSPHKAWLKILAHPTHRHGLCKFDSNTALVHVSNCGIRICVVVVDPRFLRLHVAGTAHKCMHCRRVHTLSYEIQRRDGMRQLGPKSMPRRCAGCL